MWVVIEEENRIKVIRRKTYQLRRCPLVHKPRRIPLLVAFPVLVERPLEVMDREEELLRAPLVQRAEHAVVANQCLELAPEGMALDPICFPSLLVFPLSQKRCIKGEEDSWDGKGRDLLIMYPP